MAEERMTQVALAKALDIAPATLVEWQRRGLPGRKRGGRWHFDLEAVRAWVATYQRASSVDQTAAGRADADLRKAVALAELRELELRKRRGQVVDRDAMLEAVGAMAYTLRRRLQGLPARMGTVLEGKSSEEIGRILAAEIAALLPVIASAPFADVGLDDPCVCQRCRGELAA